LIKILFGLKDNILMQNSVNAYYYENPTTENAVDVLVENGKIYKSYYSKRNFKSREEIDELIYHLVVKDGFVLDKSFKDRTEFVDTKTGSVRYVFWTNNSVEKIYREEVGRVDVDNSLVYF
jgi:hypothetical protein